MEKISGWGNVLAGQTHLIPKDLNDVSFQAFPKNKVIVRGNGRSYGDSAQITNGITILAQPPTNYSLSESGVLTVDAGATIDWILTQVIPQGWFVPVTPGTRFITIGGAIANDVHGKNHHADGTFGSHVLSFNLRTPVGDFTCSENENSELFWASIGGLGLTGVITSAVVQLIPIQTSAINTYTFRTNNVHEAFSLMSELDGNYKYSVAWIDTMAQGKNLGRSIVSFGEHSQFADLPERRTDLLVAPNKPRISIPINFPTSTLNRLTISGFNKFWYYKTSSGYSEGQDSLSNYFYPLDGVAHWNRLYGSSGFIQHQFVVPEESTEVVIKALELYSTHQVPIFLAVLKKFGKCNQGLMSFPTPGWTLAVDIPARIASVDKILHAVDDLVLSAGGRIYLAKDSRMQKHMLPQMYPRLDEFRNIRSQVDPHSVLASDLTLRLGI